jgi:predicted DNA binding protein
MYRAKIYFSLDADCVLSEVTARWNVTFPVTNEEVIDDDIIRFVIDARDRVEELFAAFDRSSEIIDLERADGNRLIVTKRACGALPVIRGNHGMLQGWDRVNGDQRVFEVVVFRREDLRGIVAELDALGTVRLGRLTPYLQPDTLLSERQSEVVTAALAAGYYEWPRETDAETLAEELGITHSTFLEHLRKAERQLLSDAISRGGRSQDPAPDEAAFMLGAETDGGHDL